MSFPTSSLTGSSGFRSNSSPKKKIAGYEQASLPTLSPEAMQLFQHLFKSLPTQGLAEGLGITGGLAGGDESSFQDVEAPAYSSLRKSGAELASRYSGLGMGAQNSSGFQNAMAAQAGDLGERLASNRLGLQQGALQQLLHLSDSLLGTKTQDNYLVPEKEGFWKGLAPGLASGIGNAAGSYLGGLGSLSALKTFGAKGIF